MKTLDFEMARRKFTKYFEIKYYSQIYDHEFVGNFTCKKQTIRDSIQIEKIKAELTGGFSFDEITGRGISREADLFCSALAVCKVCITKSPDWFELDKIEDLEDPQIVLTVAQEVFSFEASFRTPDRKQSTATHSEGTDESKDTGGSIPSISKEQYKGKLIHGPSEAMVDSEIPSISKI